MDNTIYPTHHCFDDSLDFLEKVARENMEWFKANHDQFRLVHGICYGFYTADEEKVSAHDEFAHAWVERHGTTVIFSGIQFGQFCYFEAAATEYYAEMNVKETIKYSMREICINNQKYETAGPWTDKLRALTAKKPEDIKTYGRVPAQIQT